VADDDRASSNSEDLAAQRVVGSGQEGGDRGTGGGVQGIERALVGSARG
jgi:hypothetical protein